MAFIVVFEIALRGRVFSGSKRTDVMTLGVVEEQVDVSRHMAEHT
jgi:hypothetical protein